ncbi:DUF4232 domain-containing protein [Streptomyces sp. KL116D]|uniref:DUF4232 domain-containing protein n=1 Tax=Streptomyces sp. KL116D TaxID=3045152 RepID=UPI0035585EAC
MSSIRNSRTRLLTAAATVAIAALSLTACNDGSGVKDEGPSASSSSSPSAQESQDAQDGGGESGGDKNGTDGKPAHNTAKPTASPQQPKPAATATKPAGSGSGSGTDVERIVCDGSNTKTTAAPVNRPVNHMLLTVTNTSGKRCDLYSYPAVRLGEAQSVPPVVEESQPQAVVSLEPGQSGYAAVALSATDGSGSNGYTAKTLVVSFAGPKGLADYDGPAARPALPAKGVYVDDSIKVTYWQTSMDSALTW